MDCLAPFFERFSLSARMFYSGQLCGISPNLNEPAGYLHVLRKGTLTITHPNARQIVLDTPSIVFFPRPHQHRVHGSEEEGAQLVCATVEFGVGMLNPLIASFPEPFVVSLTPFPSLPRPSISSSPRPPQNSQAGNLPSIVSSNMSSCFLSAPP